MYLSQRQSYDLCRTPGEEVSEKSNVVEDQGVKNLKNYHMTHRTGQKPINGC